ncbi:MAG: hypothetical protein JSR65_13035 [Proteobacteria bacterium]|nr:hypothetical protein [Pseudomonadota bacterium]
MSDAILMGGDQICFGRERFLVETPSLPQRLLSNGGRSSRMDPSITRTMPAISLPGEERFDDRVGIAGGESPANKNDIWWLIVVAALIAAGLTVFFLGII